MLIAEKLPWLSDGARKPVEAAPPECKLRFQPLVIDSATNGTA